MRAVRNLILFVLIGFIAFILLGWYSGFFHRTKVGMETIGPYYAIYKTHIGDYNHSRQLQDSIRDVLWELGIENYKTFGIFFDDPAKTDYDSMRSFIGRLIPNDQLSKTDRLPPGYQLYTFKQQNAALVSLPYVNQFSLYAGIYRAYPCIRDFAKAQGYAASPIIEIHDPDIDLRFILPIKKISSK